MSCETALTVPAVPHGMNAGVSTEPCAVWIRPWRAGPAWAWMEKGSIQFYVTELTENPTNGPIQNL
jgi:hypothetical protein